MAEPTTATAATTAGFIVIGLLTLPHPDLIIAGLVGGIAAILSLEAMTVWERISSVAVAIMVSGMLGPIVVRVTCEEWPEPLLIVVPGGYKTDFESVPRVLLLAYWLIKGKARRSATLHDYLLDLINGKLEEHQRTLLLPFMPAREWIDRLFYAAMLEEKTDAIARELAYMGVTAYTAFLNSRGAANGRTA